MVRSMAREIGLEGHLGYDINIGVLEVDGIFETKDMNDNFNVYFVLNNMKD